jgi:3-deoxy-7-phosphoheptulonate synthase
MALAGVAAGADGLLIEVHPRPEVALSDGPQSLKPGKFAALMEQLKRLAVALGREV